MNAKSFLRRFCTSLSAFALVLLCVSHVRADITITGDRLMISSDTILVQFKGGDLMRIKNKLTGEEFVHTTTPQPQILNMGMIDPPSKPYYNFGWHAGNPNVNPEAAQIQFNDLTRSIWMNVIVDHTTNDVTIAIWGEANREGVTGLTWGVRGLDLTGGKLILPVQGGRYLDSRVPVKEFSYAYPGDWEAQLAIWQTKTGGFVVYSRDSEARYKRISMTRRDIYADIMMETEAMGPFEKAGNVPQVEWRINAYKGDWQVPAGGYQKLMQFYRPTPNVLLSRAWVKKMRSVVTVRGSRQDPKLLDALAKQTDAAKTLLYIPDWRQDGLDVNYPDYAWNDSIGPFVRRAHELGFHVMLHTDLTAVSPKNSEYGKLKRFQVCDPRTGKPIGHRWEHGEGDARRYAIINPASETWRNVFMAKLKPLIEDVEPDALFLAGASTLLNDGNMLLPRRNFAEGCMALQRALLTAFPNVALGVDGLNELTGPYCWFAERRAKPGMPSHPISTFLFGDHVLTFASPSLPQPDIAPGAWADALGVLEGQGTLPGPVISTAEDLSRPGVAQTMNIARAWQSHDFAPFWAADWNGSRFVWKGSDDMPAAVEIKPFGTQLRFGEEILTRRVTGVPTTATEDRVPGWPGYDEKGLHGLAASRSYAAVAGPRVKEALHIPVLGAGAIIDWAQITPEFALFGLTPSKKDAAAPVNMEVALPPGLTAIGTGSNAGEPSAKDGRLVWDAVPTPGWVAIFFKPAAVASGDLVIVAHDDSAVSGGIANPLPAGKHTAATSATIEKSIALNGTPPSGAIRVHTWAVKLPDNGAALSLQAGLADDSVGDGVDFEARINGEIVWKTGRTDSGWEEGKADLSKWKGKSVLLQLVTRSRSEFGGDHAVWAEVVVK